MVFGPLMTLSAMLSDLPLDVTNEPNAGTIK